MSAPYLGQQRLRTLTIMWRPCPWSSRLMTWLSSSPMPRWMSRVIATMTSSTPGRILRPLPCPPGRLSNCVDGLIHEAILMYYATWCCFHDVPWRWQSSGNINLWVGWYSCIMARLCFRIRKWEIMQCMNKLLNEKYIFVALSQAINCHICLHRPGVLPSYLKHIWL